MIGEVVIHGKLTYDVKEWITTRGYVTINERKGVSGAIRTMRIRAAAMAKINTPQWNKPTIGSPRNSTRRCFDTQIYYSYGLGGVEAVWREV